MFAPLAALGSFGTGFMDGRRQAADLAARDLATQDKRDQMMGMEALSRALMPDQAPQPPMPGQSSAPMGGPPMTPQGPMPGVPGGPPPMPQMPPQGGGAVVPPPSSLRPPTQPGGGGMPSLDLQSLVQRIATRNPGIENNPRAMLAALQAAQPMLNNEARMQLQRLQIQMREEDRRERLGMQREQLAETKRYHDGLLSRRSGEPGMMGQSGDGQRPPGPAGTQQDGEDETIPATARLRSGGDPDPPAPVGGLSSEAIRLRAERYLQTGALTGLSSRVASDRAIRTSIENYAAALAGARGMSPEELIRLWRTAPQQARWIMGADGRATGALGTVVDHLGTARTLAIALQNGDSKIFNQIKNTFRAQFGEAAPTNVQAAAQIVGAEVMKAVGVGGAGLGEERKNVAAIVGDWGKSPEQFLGSIDTLEQLIAGQMRTKQRQAETIGLPKDQFEKLVGPRALQLLGSDDRKPAGAGGAGGGDFQLPDGWSVKVK